MTLSGVHVPMITPFDAAGEVAADSLAALAEQMLTEGAAGLVALGTTGEPSALTAAERATVLEVLTDVARRHDVPLTVGANTADELRALAGPAALPGRPLVTAALCLVPPFVRPGEDGVVAHFTALASVTPVPLIAYHVPLRTGQDLSTATIRRLAAIDGVIGVKYAPTTLDPDAVDLLSDPPPGFAVLAATDALLSPMLALGAHGGILASAHIDTASYVTLTDDWRSGRADRARASGGRLARLSTSLFAEPNPAVIKGVLHAQGRIPTPAVRLPLLPAAAATVARATDQLAYAA